MVVNKTNTIAINFSVLHKRLYTFTDKIKMTKSMFFSQLAVFIDGNRYIFRITPP